MNILSTRFFVIAVSAIAGVAIFFVLYQPKEPIVPELVEPVFVSPFHSTSIRAKGAFVFQPASNHVLYQHNASTTLPLASVTKILTAYIATQLFFEDELITIQSSDLAPEGDVGLIPGDIWKFSDLRDIMLVASANDAAETLRRASDEKLSLQGTSTTILLMNEFGKRNNLNTLSFQSVTGLDDIDVQATAYGSARDIAYAFSYIIKTYPAIFQSTRENSVNRGPVNGVKKNYKNTNVTINSMPSLIASKTGYTDTAGGNLITAFDAGLGSPVIITILGSANQDTRFEDMHILAEKAVHYINGTYYSGL